jgi:hypothetical protein
MSGIIVSTKEVIYLQGKQDESVEYIISRTMERATHSVLIVLLSMSGKWEDQYWWYIC